MVSKLKQTYLISPCYFTICSWINPSRIITRDSMSVVSDRYLTDGLLIQTNCDHDKMEPDILWSCRRKFS